MATVEVVNFPFMHETTLEKYIRTLQKIDSEHFGPIQCDQGSHWDYEVVNACDYAMKMIQKELDELKERKKAMYAELNAKYGQKGVDYIVTMDGSVHLI